MIELRDSPTTPTACLNCGTLLDHALSTKGDHVPQPGDMSICLQCHHLMAFDDNIRLRELTDAELIEVAGHKDLIRAMTALAEFKKWRKDNEAVPGPTGVVGLVRPPGRSSDRE
jgi:hypothetical protein